MQNNNLDIIKQNQSSNVFKTWIYLIFFSLLVGMLGFLLASYFNNPVFFYLGTFISIGTSFWSYWFSSSMVLKMANARELVQGDNIELQRMVEKISKEAGLPMPKIYIVEDPSPNAFATGRNPKNGVIAFTTGILSLLNKDELAGVAAHEMSHIANRDTLIMAVVAVMASIIQSLAHFAYFFGGSRDSENNSNSFIVTIISTIVIAFLAPLAATIIQLAISRKREFLADSSGSLITSRPQDLASGLVKINKYPQGMQNVNPSIAHLFISNPQKEDDEMTNRKTPWYTKLFMTHPPVEDRVAALLGK
jgi:heat shock protein HtpX